MSAAPWLDDTLTVNGREVRENFAAWFKDSKVLDHDGAPLRLFHGTERDVDEFSRRHARGWAPNNYLGHFFTRHASSASSYSNETTGSNVMPVYLALRNPYVQHVYEWQAMQGGSWSHQQIMAWKKSLLDKGHDGIVDSVGVEFIAFKPSQIKSAIGNTGLYLPNSGSVTDHKSGLDLIAARKAKATVQRVSRAREGVKP